MSALLEHDIQLLQDHPVIIGLDEAGRGAWAGPVVSCAFLITPEIVAQHGDLLGEVNDSKKVSKKRRVQLFERLFELDCFVISSTSHRIIDNSNILSATLRGMGRGMEELISGRGLDPNSVLALMDGNFWRWETPQPPEVSCVRTLVKGDGKSAAIAAASILAKEWRDNYMRKMDIQYPGYGFDRGFGYGVPGHKDALMRLGPSPIHRLSYQPVKEAKEHYEQQ